VLYWRNYQNSLRPVIMGRAVRGTSVRFRALIDGQARGSALGSDVDDQGKARLLDSVYNGWSDKRSRVVHESPITDGTESYPKVTQKVAVRYRYHASN
jgi:hypothetical protein